MRSAVLALFLISGSVFASFEADPAKEWLRDDAPHVYMVRQGEAEADAARRFVKDPQDWPEVWCPWPGYEPPVPIGPGDLLVRVQVNGRGWIQRARLGNGDNRMLRYWKLSMWRIELSSGFRMRGCARRNTLRST